MKLLKSSKLFFVMALTTLAQAAHAQTPREVADTFYSAFARRDAATMESLYENSNSPIFSDPIFQNLNSRETKGMWAMLVAAGHDLVVTHAIESATNDQVVVAWRAEYTYSATGNKVVNQVRSTIEVRNGKIINQQDDFDLCSWTTQALGFAKGKLACIFPAQLREQARANLEKYLLATGWTAPQKLDEKS